MKTIKIIIERSDDLFSAYAENVEGIYASGDSVEDVKKSVLEAIELLIKYNTDKNIPDILKGEYEITYKFDIESFFNYYGKIFTLAALERMTGINQKQLQHYSSGLKKPREPQRKRIEKALHNLGNELKSVEF